jgi:hypothetical protein
MAVPWRLLWPIDYLDPNYFSLPNDTKYKKLDANFELIENDQ